MIMRESETILTSIIIEFGECVLSHTKRSSKRKIRKDAIYYFYDTYWLCKSDGSLIGPHDQLEPLLEDEILDIERRTLKIQSILKTEDLYQFLSTSLKSKRQFTVNTEIWIIKEGHLLPYLWASIQ